MAAPITINARILDALYTDALALSDEVRGAFDLSGRVDAVLAGADRAPAPRNAHGEDLRAVALSCEALRTTTRMMHGIAWLLNHRAFVMGELSAFQLRRHGRLAPEPLSADAERVALLPYDLQALIAETQALYARLLRLDQAFRDTEATSQTGPQSALDTLRQRLAEAS